MTIGSRARHRRVAGLQHAPERRRHAEHREVVAGDVADRDPLGAVVGAQPDEVDVVGGEILERAALVLEVLVVEPRQVVRILVALVLDGEHVAGRPASRTGSGLSSSRFTIVKTAALAPMPRPSVRTTATVKSGALSSVRSPRRTSCQS